MQVAVFDADRYHSCLEYIRSYWPQIIRYQPEDVQTLIGMPGRYIVANHKMFQELYYWDSYFISVGLEHTEHREIVPEITENLLYLQKRFGRIPNTSRFYHLSRSQPPFLTGMILLTQRIRGATDSGWLADAFEVACEEYTQVWRGGTFPDHREVLPSLSRYYDIDIWHCAAEAESGWDMTYRFEDRCLDFIAVDLNCLLYKYELDFARFAGDLNRSDLVGRWQQQAQERRSQINRYLWNEERGYYFDYDFKNEQQSTFYSLAGFFALFCGVASDEQARRMVKEALPLFEMPHGLVTAEECDVSAEEVGKQWAWPNGWAPLHWIAVAGLQRYGFKEEARRIALKWVELVNAVFEDTGCNYEKYDVVAGQRATADRYPDQPGFGWTNAIFVKFVEFLNSGEIV